MLDLGENLRKLILAGVGVAAVTKEKGADVLNELVKKGELTIEQGKVLNEELKHNIKDAIRENVTIVTPPAGGAEGTHCGARGDEKDGGIGRIRRTDRELRADSI